MHHFSHVKPQDGSSDKEDWILAMFANIVDSTGWSFCQGSKEIHR